MPAVTSQKLLISKIFQRMCECLGHAAIPRIEISLLLVSLGTIYFLAKITGVLTFTEGCGTFYSFVELWQ